MLVSQRVGSVSGRDQRGEIRVVSVYRDGSLIKLCGPTGSCLVGDMDGILDEVANQYGLTDVSFDASRRVA